MLISRRFLLLAVPAAAWAADSAKGRNSIVKAFAYPDSSTESIVFRLTDPAYTSHLPPYYARSISRKGNFLVFSSDAEGSMNLYRLDYRNGEARQITEGSMLDPASVTLSADDRNVCFADGDRILITDLNKLRTRQIYQAESGYELASGLSVTEDHLYACAIERQKNHHRLRLIRLTNGSAMTIAEADTVLSDPIPRPKRASVLYRRGSDVYLANFDGKQDYRLKLAEGTTGPAHWSPNGRTVLYLNFPPAGSHKLNAIREFIPDTNDDAAVADTTQYVGFGLNGDASVFVGASGSKASPHVLLLVRAVKRELILCEHRASDPHMVSPVFSPNSQRVFFVSDQHGKPAIYTMPVDKLVSETDDAEESPYK